MIFINGDTPSRDASILVKASREGVSQFIQTDVVLLNIHKKSVTL